MMSSLQGMNRETLDIDRRAYRPEVMGPQTRKYSLWKWLLIPFIIGMVTVSHLEGLSKVMVLYGLFVAGLFSVYSVYNRLTVQPEILVYFIWIAWSLSGAIFATDKGLYYTDLFTLVQIGALVLVISGIASLRVSMSEIMFAVLVGVLIMLFLSFQHGEIQQAAGEESRARAAGIVGNANGFAYHLLFINYAALYFWRRRKALWWKVFLAIPIALSMIGIVFSGSRTGLLGIATFFILLGLIAFEKKLPRNPLKIILISPVVLAALFYAFEFIMSSTFVGKRMLSTQDNSSIMRLQLFLDGVNMILHNPVFGVGLNNYMAHSSLGLYSHSNYIEVAANTGVVGLFFYYSVYALLWRRLGRIKKMVHDPDLIYQIGLFRAAILTILLQSAQTVNVRSKITWIFLAGAIGYSWAKERQLLRRSLEQDEQLRMRSGTTYD